MKKAFKVNYIFFVAAFVVAFSMQSCDDDESADIRGATENKVYLTIQEWAPVSAPQNSAPFAVVNTPIGAVVQNADKLEAKFPVHCTHPSPNAVEVKLGVDNALLEDGYLALPDGVTVTLNNASLTIPAGEKSSIDSVSVSISDADLAVLDPGTYMVPVKIISATNAELSTNLQAAYVLITVTASNIQSHAGQNDIEGDLIDNSDWSGTVNYTLRTGPVERMFTTQTNRYWRVDSGSDTFDFEVDMISEQSNITGIRMHTSNQNYNIVRLSVESSKDGDTWTSHGEGELSFGTYQYVKFYESFEARYLKITVLQRRHSTQVRMARFEVYTNP